jgi:Cu(I)/Ag(I) efflux system membrane fusion protein
VLWIQHARNGWPFDAPVAADSPDAAQLTDLDEMSGQDRTHVDVTSASTLPIRLEAVTRQPLALSVRAVATIVPDESRIVHVHTRVSGWVEQLDVSTTGQFVRAGQPVARIFSQELLSSQTEYLAARRVAAASNIATAVLASGRARLGVLGMTQSEIEAIEQSGEPRRLVTVVSPRTGVVVDRGVTAGTAVDASTTLLTIADLSRVWAVAEVPEADIPGIRAGSTAMLEFPASGRVPFPARVEFLYPTLTDRSRTLRVRLPVANSDGVMRPGLYGTAEFKASGAEVLSVPRDAVVDTGRSQHVFVVAGDRYEPRLVTLGMRLADRVEIRSGLTEGEMVVAAGVFLLDSESRLRASGGGTNHSHSSGSTPAPVADPHAAHRK